MVMLIHLILIALFIYFFLPWGHMGKCLRSQDLIEIIIIKKTAKFVSIGLYVRTTLFEAVKYYLIACICVRQYY